MNEIASSSTQIESQQYPQLQGYVSGEENIMSSLVNGGVLSLSSYSSSSLIRGESHGESIRTFSYWSRRRWCR